MACTCGHAKEEHGNNPRYPASTECFITADTDDEEDCDCIAFEEADDS